MTFKKKTWLFRDFIGPLNFSPAEIGFMILLVAVVLAIAIS